VKPEWERIQEIITRSGVAISASVRRVEGGAEVVFRASGGGRRVLHWGLSAKPRGPWQKPPGEAWPPGSAAYGDLAVQSPLDEKGMTIKVPDGARAGALSFVLYFPDTGRWDNNHGENYHIELPPGRSPVKSPLAAVREMAGGGRVLFEEDYALGGPAEGLRLALAVFAEAERLRLVAATELASAVLHWGVAEKSRYEWRMPPEAFMPRGSAAFGEKAARTAFAQRDGLHFVELVFPREGAPLGVPFVIFHARTGAWLKDNGRNFFVPLRERGESPLGPRLAPLADEIVEAEAGDHSWSLMHRFNLCHDLLDRARGDLDGLALLFVWLRFSALRQLDWQRRYNTKPRELSHAQDRLTLRLAGVFAEEPEGREVVRLMVSTLGRGGDGQRVRDEILNIMHRRGVKERAGTFLEQWHQKLHNNTTPDDVAICEAYVQFLRSGGDLEKFYGALREGGVTRERLRGFERPITVDPEFRPEIRDGLVEDFEGFLRILKSVHSGTDLETSLAAAGYLLDAGTRGDADYVVGRRAGGRASELVPRITAVRRRLARTLAEEKDHGRVRDALYLDLSLEEFLRTAVERDLQDLSADEMVELVGEVAENLALTGGDFELRACRRQWQRLKAQERYTRQWSLHAGSVLERLGRWVQDRTEACDRLFQPKAEHLGGAFGAEPWTIKLFTEELVRGRPAFVLSALIRRLTPVLRRHARLGDWQVISPGSSMRAVGRVAVVAELEAVQGRAFDSPTVVVAEKVRGTEEPPEGVTAVISPGTVDLVSHVAVRARNAGILFATCYDPECLERLRKKEGRSVSLRVAPGGDITFSEAEEGEAAGAPSARRPVARAARPGFSSYAISWGEFAPGLVGGKSLNVAGLRGKLPEWIGLPASAAVPFGAFEKVLSLDANREARERIHGLLGRVEEDRGRALAAIREAVMGLEPPQGFFPALEKAMAEAGLRVPPRDEAWRCVKGVWASKWNERAYLSRRAWSMAEDDLFMAVLIQRVVEAEYSFVIHTVNPFTGDASELYAEVVLGLGETLVGNYPGRAMGFTARKRDLELDLLSYPSKSAALYGGGTIFRSDSSGEDLAGYAGAGLYESLMTPEPRARALDYAEERLLWQEDFQRELMGSVARLGLAVEEAMGAPQDIEGAFEGGRFHLLQARPQVAGPGQAPGAARAES